MFECFCQNRKKLTLDKLSFLPFTKQEKKMGNVNIS